MIEETESKQRELITRGIVGPWNQSLRTTFRLGNEIATLAKAFQMNFLQERYSIDEMSIMQSFNFEGRILEYYHAASTISADYIVDLIYKLTRLYDIHPSDVAVLGSTMEYMRGLIIVLEPVIRKIPLSHSIQKKNTNKIIFNVMMVNVEHVKIILYCGQEL